MPNVTLNPAAKATTGKAARKLPDGAKEILQDFVVAVLRGKIEKENFTKFAADWFQKLADEEEEKKNLAKSSVTQNESIAKANEAPVNNQEPRPKFRTEPPQKSEIIEIPQPSIAELSDSQPKGLVNQPSTFGGQFSTNAPVQDKFSTLVASNSEVHELLPNPPESQTEEKFPESEDNSQKSEDNPRVLEEKSRILEGNPQGPEETSLQPARRSVIGRRQGVSAESYDPSALSEDPEVVKSFPKTNEQLNRVKEAVQEVLLFRSLDSDHLMKIIEALEEIKVEANQDVITFGDEKADFFYVIENGEFDCFVEKGGAMVKTHEYINKGSFGELALMYNQPRAATIQSRTTGHLWRLDRETFKRIVVGGAYAKRKLYMSLLEKVDFIADLQSYEKQNVCDALTAKAYNNGDTVIKQGDVGDGMYFVEAGEVVCMRNEDGNDQEVGRAGPGQYVGELALIADQPRAATVTATADGTKLAFLDSKAFERLMGPCVDILKKNKDRYRDKIVAVFGENSLTLT